MLRKGNDGKPAQGVARASDRAGGGTLAQMQASLQQAEANRDLAQVTWDRDKNARQQGWVTQQQGDTDRLTLEAREAAVAVANANITAQEAQLRC
jgi:multidrug resistance efflux pump